MTSWRTGASQQAQDDLDAVCAAALAHATQLINRDGRLAPFATAIAVGGGDAHAELADAGDHRSARQALDRLYGAARRDAEAYRAVAFTADITLEGGRAIRIEAEHREGVTVALRVPYRRGFFGGVKLGTMRASSAPRRVWR